MVIYFLTENDRAYTTRLNKCLFYSDFMSYKYTGNSISSYTYCAIDKGPVLDNYKRLFSELWEEEYIESVEQKFGKGTIDKFIPAKVFDKNLFSDDEVEIMKWVSDNFKFKSTEELIELSHKEKGWIDNIAGKSSISYQQYAPLLSI